MTSTINKKSKFGWFKKIATAFAFVFCVFNLTACASVEKRGMSTDFQVISCTYDAGNDTTNIVWYSNLNNESIYDMKQVYFKFDLYKDNEFVRTTDNVYWNIQISHGSNDAGRRNFTVEGNIDDIKINQWSADFATLWESYEAWFIGTIIGAVVLTIALLVGLFLADGDLLEMLEDSEWILYLLIPLALGLGISGITSWVAMNWVPICIVGGGIVAVAVLVALIALIAFIIDEFDLDLIEGKYVALTVLGLVLIGGFVCGCIFWKWWACLLILLGASALVACIVVISKAIKNALEKHEVKDSKKKGKDNNDELEDDSETPEEEKQVKAPKTYRSKIGFDQIAGLEEAKEVFREKVILPFEHPEIYEKFGKKAGGGILLYGLPGTGKTMFAEATSKELNATFIPVKCSDIKSKWYGESEQKVKAIFAKAKRSKKAIIFFDEFEAIGAKRTDDGNNGNNDLVPEILAEMQGIGSNKSDCTIMIIAATNKPWAIDSAFMRPGRFDEKIYIPLPDFIARKKLFEIQLSKLPVADDLDYDYLAKITDGFNGADIKEVCEKLKMSAIKDSLNKGTDQTIGMDDVERIEKTIKSSVSQEDIIQLKAFEEGLK